jgi:hypothetical protein
VRDAELGRAAEQTMSQALVIAKHPLLRVRKRLVRRRLFSPGNCSEAFADRLRDIGADINVIAVQFYEGNMAGAAQPRQKATGFCCRQFLARIF